MPFGKHIPNTMTILNTFATILRKPTNSTSSQVWFVLKNPSMLSFPTSTSFWFQSTLVLHNLIVHMNQSLIHNIVEDNIFQEVYLSHKFLLEFEKLVMVVVGQYFLSLLALYFLGFHQALHVLHFPFLSP